ncbi:Vang-like protein isoform 2 [Schistosoma japonicum]|uniref:Vang-like protein isoform 2 n=1 Tax=Schistosoma japonicum TaxID=6182 RepID=A0A4Z2D6C0_SCHJA|nr:Vang-like protein 1 [Schistosoma japonicum]TNN12035.1 Vang-like protein isoform 2 [Schistosoma japonicum]
MDGESVRSGRSEKSDRSRRSKRIQRTSNGSSNQPVCMFQGQVKGVLASPQNQPLAIGQTIQNMDTAIRPSQCNLMPVVQQPHMNMYPPQPLGMQQPSSHPYTLETWIPPLMPMNPNFSCSQPSMYIPNAQSWGDQSASQVYAQQMIAPSMPTPFTRQPICSGAQSNQIQSQQQQVGSFVSPGQQHPLAHTPSSHVLSSQIPSHPSSQVPEPYRSERFDTQLTQDENAWVEEATAVTGATSETGLSGDNFSRFGARYGLATSLGVHGNGGTGYNISGAAAALIRSEADEIKVFKCSHTLSLTISAFLGISSLLSPILMLLLPLFPFWIGWSTEGCEPTCEGHVISISVKLVLLTIALWFLSSPCRPFCGSSTAILPRIRLCRTLFLCLILVVLFAFWLFYTVRVIQPKESDYLSIVVFAGSLTDTLLFLYYAAIALMELRKIRFQYVIHIVRSPDGMSKTLKCGEMSLQRAAVEVLQFYMVEFTAYNPNQNPSVSSGGGNKRNRRTGSTSGGGGSKYKFYDVDNGGAGLGKSENGVTYTVEQSACAITAPSASVRLYEEIELEKRIRKRRMRLLLAVEEAFTHVKRLAAENCSNGGTVGVAESDQTMLPFKNPRSNERMSKINYSPGKSLDPYEAAQAVFPTLIRPLQKYMRVTRQQARHPVDMVIDHLALCLAYGLSPHAFLERFNPSAATPQQDAAAAAAAISTVRRAKHQQNAKRINTSDNPDPFPLLPKLVHPGGQQMWSIVADRALSRSLADGAIFQLRRGNDLSLLCTVRRLPLIYLIEEILEPLEAGRFVLRTDNAV